jgi:hypothetical protein
LTLDVKKSNSSNETPNVMTVGVENYGLSFDGYFTMNPMCYGTPYIVDNRPCICHLHLETMTFDDKKTSFQPTIVVTYISAKLGCSS